MKITTLTVAAVYDRRLSVVAAAALLLVSFILPAFGQTKAVPPSSLEPIANAAAQPVAATKIDPFSDPLIKQIQARHEKAVNGDTKETKSLTTDLEKLTKEQPDNHLLQAYLGSVYTLDSRDAWPGPGKLTYLKNGGKELDAAVAADPDNPAVRFIRAIDYYELPTFFGKRPTARDDFQILVKQVEGVVQTPFELNVDTQQAIYYYAGLCYKQLSQLPDAKDAWERGLKLNPTSPLGVKIAAELKNLK
jgi:tetratricopeptide (TPR) repeat protein